MRGLGDYGDELARMLETLQPPAMQQARQQNGQVDPMVQQVKAVAQQQIQQLIAENPDLGEFIAKKQISGGKR